ncbi:peptidyl-prolyl isomerase CWC27 [Kwoniella shandongensis]|uniref:Peptidyl-prolyl isomerase CWC27 n=1 Tax=Kwoniella shandongensis TaxID=1734106 RepID=A0A5M6BYB9_9TREE|nr:peptidyl-prolyl isomerase CWC27 [Kwoniella shandongensis]KAA5527846.1 peptidyl-prolyl isomerase CWC27 [Kwoniella shandongensis]
MSNLYVTEPATNGKVIIDTTAGELEIELWGKEAPKAVRNFLALAMEGYYDGVIFHRVVPGFIIQSGDPTGTGMGGESFYGEPFQDEIHGRLKYNRRGLVGMANNGKRHTNTSQFFITLDKADELTNKHTMFGKIVGNTIYNVMNIGNLDIDKEERPIVPPKIRGIRIIENPFDDIVPRITASERKAQQQARLEARRETEQREKRAKAKKNTGLLSFGDSEEIPEEQVTIKKKSMTRKDLVDPSDIAPPKPVKSFVEVPASLKDLSEGSDKKEKKAALDLKEIRAQHEREKAGSSVARQAEIKRMEEDLRRLKKRTGEASDSDSDDSERRAKRRKGPSYLEEELAKYSRGRGRAAAKAGKKRGRRDEEDDLLKELSKFSSKVQQAEAEDDDIPRGITAEKGEGGVQLDENGEELEVDDDVGWMRHRLKFEIDEKELTRRAEDEYSVIDPRAKARELAGGHKREKEGHRKGPRTAADVGRSRR